VEDAKSFMSARASGDAEELLEALRDPAFRHLAAYALADLGETRAIPGLLKLMRAVDRNLRIAGVRSLGRLRAKEAINEIIEIADDDSDPLVREWAVYSIGLIGHASSHNWLLAKTRDTDEGIRVVALAALASADDPEDVRDIVDDTFAPTPFFRRWRLRRVVRRTVRRIMHERSIPAPTHL
jgi:HEAT repeat protein